MFDLRPGQVVDRYKVIEEVGRGGMAVVYRVRHQHLGSEHALKLLHITGKSIQARLEQEGKLQAELRHPNIVSVTDIISVNGLPGLILEWVNGPSLEELLRWQGLTFEQVDLLVRGVLAGVQEAHRQGIAHRDLKPANILIQIRGDEVIPKVADFGLAKLYGAGGVTRTKSGMSLGTPPYMAPEQIRNAKHADARADIFSLGAVIYEMITRRRAFDGRDNLEIMMAVGKGDYKCVREWVPSVPDSMERTIRGALRVDLSSRLESVSALIAVWTDDGRNQRPRDEKRILRELAQSAASLAGLPENGLDLSKTGSILLGEVLRDDADEVIDLNTQYRELAPVDLGDDPELALDDEGGQTTYYGRVRRRYGVVVALFFMVTTSLAVICFALILLVAVRWGLQTGSMVQPQLSEVEWLGS